MLLCTKPFDVLSQPPKPHFSMFIYTYTLIYTSQNRILIYYIKLLENQNVHTEIIQKTCLLFNLIRCLKNHLHFNVFEIYQKSKKDFKKREKFLDWAQCKKIVYLANFFNPVLCSFFIILDVFSPLFIYQWTAGWEISDQNQPPWGQNYHTWEFIFNTMFSFATQQTLLFY